MIRACLVTLLGLFLTVEPVFAADADAAVDPVVALVATTAPPARGAVLPVLYGTLAGLQAYDGWSTVMALRQGAREANPAMAAVASNPGAIWAVKVGATMASIYAAERLWKRHRHVEAIATMVAVNALMSAVAAHNRSVLRGLQ
jgi:hypothetical protein